MDTSLQQKGQQPPRQPPPGQSPPLGGSSSGGSPLRTPSPEGQQLVAALHERLEGLEGSFAALAGTLAGQVQASQEQTLEHLLLYEAAVDEMQASAADAAAAYATLLATCRQLGEQLRGVDLLAGRVATIRGAVDALEAQVGALVPAAPGPAGAAGGAGGGGGSSSSRPG